MTPRELIIRLTGMVGNPDKVRAEQEKLFNEYTSGLCERVKFLEGWREEAAGILTELNLQQVGIELGVPLGQDIAPQVLPKIRELKETIARFEWIIKNCGVVFKPTAECSKFRVVWAFGMTEGDTYNEAIDKARKHDRRRT